VAGEGGGRRRWAVGEGDGRRWRAKAGEGLPDPKTLMACHHACTCQVAQIFSQMDGRGIGPLQVRHIGG